MKDKTQGIPNLPKQNQGFPYWDFPNHSLNFSPPAQRGSETILTISEYGCHTKPCQGYHDSESVQILRNHPYFKFLEHFPLTWHC